MLVRYVGFQREFEASYRVAIAYAKPYRSLRLPNVDEECQFKIHKYNRYKCRCALEHYGANILGFN